MRSLEGSLPNSSAVISLTPRGAWELLVRPPCADLSLTFVSSRTVKSLSVNRRGVPTPIGELSY
jgi:hypothetical protein